MEQTDGCTALAITPSHHQNTHVFAHGRKNMNDIFNKYVCSASHMSPELHFQNVWRELWMYKCTGAFLWWCHQMETFSALLAICAGNSPVNSPPKGQWCGALMFSLICIWINSWVNNREVSDSRCHCAHYDVTVMLCPPQLGGGQKIAKLYGPVANLKWLSL